MSFTASSVAPASDSSVAKLSLLMISVTGATELAVNDIGEIRLRTAKPLVFDGYATNRLTGSFILIEQGTNATVAAGMLSSPREIVKPENGDYVI